MSIAFTFPGQGSQFVGMGKAWFDNFPEAREVFEEVDDTLKYKLSEIMFDGPIEELTLTEHTQPALMTVSMAIMRVIKKLYGNIYTNVDFVAGHSLGEYTSLAAIESLSLHDAALLLQIRGKAMQEAVSPGKGAMIALLGATIEEAENITQEASQDQMCQIANDNTVGQIVLSGDKEAIERAIVLASELGKRAIKLNVSAPFHCNLMRPAQVKMASALQDFTITPCQIPLISNITAQPTSDPDLVKKLLVEQVVGKVRWRETILYFSENSVDKVFEIGAGNVLTNMIKRITADIEGISIQNIDDLDKLSAYLS